MASFSCDGILLVDNGSLQPAATLSLRQRAQALGERLGQPVVPASILHSSRVPVEALGGQPAETLETALARMIREGAERFVVLPYFFGRSRAVTHFVPMAVSVMQARCRGLDVRVTPPLVDLADSGDDRVARVLADNVRAAAGADLERFAVVMVDHGTPVREVNAVRQRVGRQLAGLLGDRCSWFSVASMERRDGPAYDFNEPLLERALRDPDLRSAHTDVIVSMLFLGPGRHAGPGGDITEICATAEAENPPLRTRVTELAGSHPLMIDILAERFAAAADLAPLP